MTRIYAEVEQYKLCGGRLEFSFFDASLCDEQFERNSIQQHLEALSYGVWHVRVDASKFDGLRNNIISVPDFLGCLCDCETRILRTPWRTLATDPIDRFSGGQFARAFGAPVQNFSCGDMERQRLFTRITDYIIPRGTEVVIRDWSSRDLGKLSNYFDAGMEWWGVYLFTIFQPAEESLVVISGSDTD